MSTSTKTFTTPGGDTFSIQQFVSKGDFLTILWRSGYSYPQIVTNCTEGELATYPTMEAAILGIYHYCGETNLGTPQETTRS